MNKKLRTIAAASTALGLLLLSGCASKQQTIDTDFSEHANNARIAKWISAKGSPEIPWESCAEASSLDGSEAPPLGNATFDCAFIDVPIDWFDQETGTTQVPLLRARASGDGPKRNLLLNPGGPGDSGTQLAFDLGLNESTDELRTSFNLIGFDPRGVDGVLGGGDPFECAEDATGSCSPSDKLRHNASTAAVAHDMEYLRLLLGDAPLNYLGYSYGTYLGALYATLFPSAVGSMVLDGPATADLFSSDGRDSQVRAFADARERFLKACLAGELGECPFTGSLKRAEEDLAAAGERFDKDPVSFGERGEVDGESIEAYLMDALYQDRATWPEIASVLNGVMANDREALSKILGASIAISDHIEQAVVCSVRQARENEDCEHQPLIDPPVAYSGSAEILVIAVTGDPATPFTVARPFVKELGNARLVTVDGEGHGAAYSQSSCASEIATRYFVNGTLPEQGARCFADASS